MAAIQNFVFDMGGVLMDFDPAFFAHLFVDSDSDTHLIEQALYRNPAWALLDAGAISDATMEQIAAEQLPERLHATLHKGFAEWEQHQLVLQPMNDIVCQLHDAGFGCYLLSNAGVRWWRVKERIPAMRAMDGFVISAFERLMKPDPLIYTTLCTRYHLDPSTCEFIDDNKSNCIGAERAGMKGYHYNGDPDAFVAHLRDAYGISL